MLLDFEVKSCSRHCAATQRTLEPGDVYFSVIYAHPTELVRQDFCVEAWEGPPEDSLGWWRSRIPTKEGAMSQLAPTDVMLNLFDTLAARPEEEEFRYLLGLLLLRRRVLRRDNSCEDASGREILNLYCARRSKQSDLVVAEPDATLAAILQQRMIDLLYGDTVPAEPTHGPADD